MSIRRRTHFRSRLAVTGLVASLVLAACSTSNSTPKPTTTAPPAQPSTIASTIAPSAAPTRVTGSAVTARSLRGAETVPCHQGSSDAQCVKAGTYALDASIPPGTVTLDVPAGWFEWDPGGGTEGLLVDSGRDAPDGSGWGVLLSAVGTIPRDPCGELRGSIPADQTTTVDGDRERDGRLARIPGDGAAAARPARRRRGANG